MNVKFCHAFAHNRFPLLPEFTMAIRARIKSKIKSLLFGASSSPSPSVNHTAPTVSKTTFVPPTVSTSAESSTNKENGSQAPEQKTVVDEVKTSPAVSDAPGTTAETDDTPAQQVAESDASANAEADLDEAAFIVEVVDLFPETCPHCGASSHNNWIRIENKFACGSCEAAY